MKHIIVMVLLLSLCTSISAEEGSGWRGLPLGSIETPYTVLHKDRLALVVIDMQNDLAHMGGSHTLSDAATFVPNVEKIVKIFKEQGKSIVYLVRIYKSDGSNVDAGRKQRIERGELEIWLENTWGAELLDSLVPEGTSLDFEGLMDGKIQELGDNQYVIYKSRYSGFYDTPLDEFLRSKNIDSVMIVGSTFYNCVRGTQFGATDRDYRVGLIPEACSLVGPQGMLAMYGEGVQLMTVKQVDKLMKD